MAFSAFPPSPPQTFQNNGVRDADAQFMHFVHILSLKYMFSKYCNAFQCISPLKYAFCEFGFFWYLGDRKGTAECREVCNLDNQNYILICKEILSGSSGLGSHPPSSGCLFTCPSLTSNEEMKRHSALAVCSSSLSLFCGCVDLM